ncbi:hypothetical protein SAMN06265365_103146 [Tistlia consotensis]|uniref:Uncharacterized protein n=1 Tax=Tistlia consotensis USBA 355 TaxID=560819 RepID=A0A1Y6BLU4_9PROT|nr:hypothetical protein [Tistlia consotensis]SMF17131.1 hypothetical protein SAMN05428998_10681 [Tistlia consotensis USBA 355]SNR40696.1 hypothetical protein SAMN06265365_103146 [Tistlia consotensis]
MHSDGFDLLTLSLARAGGLPLHIEQLARYDRERRAMREHRTPSDAAAREAARQMSLRRPVARAAGRVIAGLGQRLARYGARLSGPTAAQPHGCG